MLTGVKLFAQGHRAIKWQTSGINTAFTPCTLQLSLVIGHEQK